MAQVAVTTEESTTPAIAEAAIAPGTNIKATPTIKRVRRRHALIATVLFVLLIPGVLFNVGAAILQDDEMDAAGFQMKMRWADLVIVPVFFLAYHYLSGNKAGGYYPSMCMGCGQMVYLPQHLVDLCRRNGKGSVYSMQIAKENEMRQFRVLNALESSIFFVVCAALPGAYGDGYEWFHLLPAVVVYLLLHIGAASINLGECMWQLEDVDGKETASPLTQPVYITHGLTKSY